MKNLIKILFITVLISSAYSCHDEEDLAPVADLQPTENPLEVTEQDLIEVLQNEGYQLTDNSRGKKNVSFQDVMQPATGTVVGRSLLARRKNALVMGVITKLIPGHSYTAWWVVFNKPDNCLSEDGCGADEDFGNGNKTGLAMMFADGAVAKADGKTFFSACREIGDDSGMANEDVFPGIVDNMYLTNPKTSDVFLVIRSHGPAIKGQTRAQTSSWGGGCVDFYAPFSQIPKGPGECADMQVSLHFAK